MKTKLLITFFTLSSLFFNAQNLVAHYPFNNNANDESGNGNHGIVNGATLTTDRFGNIHSAYKFDGINQYITIPNNENINIAEGESYSVSFWVKHNAQNNGKYIISKYNATFGTPCYAIGTGSQGDSYSWHEFSPSNGQESRGNIDLNDNKWHNIISVFKTGENVTIYVDGVLDVEHATSHIGSITNTRDLTIGCGANLAQFYNGLIDDIKIYKKALTLEEIQNEANDLVAYYPFNGNANDESGNVNHGTINGAELFEDKDGILNSAYQFDGTNDFIECINPGPIGTSPRTISFWAKTNVVPSGHSNVILFYGGNPTSSNYGDRLEISLNSMSKRGLVVSVGGTVLVREFDNSDNDWHFYTVVFEGGTGKQITDFKLYADGQLLTNTTHLTNNPHTINTLNNYPIYFGDLPGYNRYFNGFIDELRIYNKVLSESDILNLYNTNTLSIEKLKHPLEGDFYVFNNTIIFKNTVKTNEIKGIEVFNLLGQKVFETKTISKEISLNILTNGIYVLKTKNKNNQYSTLKFLIN